MITPVLCRVWVTSSTHHPILRWMSLTSSTNPLLVQRHPGILLKSPLFCAGCAWHPAQILGIPFFSPGWRTHHILPCTGVPSLQKFQDMNINIRLKICMLHKFRLKLDVSDIQLQNCHNSPNSNLMVLNLFPTLTCGVFVFSA